MLIVIQLHISLDGKMDVGHNGIYERQYLNCSDQEPEVLITLPFTTMTMIHVLMWNKKWEVISSDHQKRVESVRTLSAPGL